MLDLSVGSGLPPDIIWLPIAHTELHLSSLHFPIAVRFERGRPLLGVIVATYYLRFPVVDSVGQWRGGYRPISLRCLPFRFDEIGADPLDNISVTTERCRPSNANGLAIVDQNGKPSPHILELERLLRLLVHSQQLLADVLDRLVIANLLTPLSREDVTEEAALLYTVDGCRLGSADRRVIGALTRQSFTPLDIAVACVFSQRLLSDKLRPNSSPFAATPRNLAGLPAVPDGTFGARDFGLVLDDDELISAAHIGGLCQ
jgi:hypothetical protein